MAGDDKDLIEQKTTALTEAAGKIAEKAYAQSQQKEGAEGAADASADAASSADDEVVDAEFEEVKDDNK